MLHLVLLSLLGFSQLMSHQTLFVCCYSSTSLSRICSSTLFSSSHPTPMSTSTYILACAFYIHNNLIYFTPCKHNHGWPNNSDARSQPNNDHSLTSTTWECVAQGFSTWAPICSSILYMHKCYISTLSIGTCWTWK